MADEGEHTETEPTKVPIPHEIPTQQLRRLHRLTPFFRSWRMVGVAAAAGAGVFRDDLDKLEWIWDALHGDADVSVIAKGLAVIFVVAVAAVFVSWLSWRATGFAIISDRGSTATLLFHRGLLVKQRSQVRLNRVQSVDVNQPLFPRLFGLAAVRLDMAAGDEASVNLAYLAVADAWRVREEILPHTRAASSASPPSGFSPSTPGGPALAEQQAGVVSAEHSVIGEISLPRLIKAAMLEGVGEWALLVVWFVVLVVVVALWGLAGLVAGAAGIVPVTIAILVQLRQQVQSVFRDANFRLGRTSSGIRISSGLTSTINRTIDYDRIQGVRMQEPYLWRRLGWARVEVDVAGATKGETASLMPVAERAEALRLIADVTGERISVDDFVPPGRSARLLDPWVWSFLGVRLLASGAVTRTGRWRRTHFFVPYGRVQSVSAQQGWLQRRLGLVTVFCDLPQGATRWQAGHRDASESQGLMRHLVQQARAHRSPTAKRSEADVAGTT